MIAGNDCLGVVKVFVTLFASHLKVLSLEDSLKSIRSFGQLLPGKILAGARNRDKLENLNKRALRIILD